MRVQTSLRASKQFILLCVLIHQFGSATTSYSRRPLSADHHYMRVLAVAAVVSLRYALVVDQDTEPQFSLPPVTWVPGILLRPRSFRQLTSNPLLSKASILDPTTVALFITPYQLHLRQYCTALISMFATHRGTSQSANNEYE